MIDTRNWTRENLAWAAGFLDGEGSFTVEASKNPIKSIRITCGQNHPELLYRLQNILGCGTVLKQTTRDFYIWRISQRHLVHYIGQALYEWMSTKRKFEIDKQHYMYAQAPERKNYKW